MGMSPLGESMTAAKAKNGIRILNRAARERSLIEAAGKLFSEHGYEATTTRQIAAVAGCAEGLISRYFSGKAGLLRALIKIHFAEEVDEFRDDSSPAATLAEEIMRRVVWDVNHIRADHDFIRVVIPQLILDPTVGREVRDVGPGRHEKIIVERLAKHAAFRALPEEEQKAFGQLINAIGLMFGFFNPSMGQDPAQAKERAIIVARILGRAF
jgi:AcrR family transcriptional regulator